MKLENELRRITGPGGGVIVITRSTGESPAGSLQLNWWVPAGTSLIQVTAGTANVRYRLL